MKKIDVLIDEEQVQKRVGELGRQISKDYAGGAIHCIGVLKGAFVFMADLIRNLELDEVTCDFLTISSYGDLTQSSGVVKILTDLTVPIENKDILIIEDIVDTGLTLRYMIDNLETRAPKSIRVCSFLHKPEKTRTDIKIDYCGFTVSDQFIVGYGLDAAQKYRDLRYLGFIEGGEE